MRDINVNGAVLNVDATHYNSYSNIYDNNNQQQRGGLVSEVLNSQVGKKVTDKFFSLKTAVGTGLNDLVHSIAPLLEGPEDQQPLPPHLRKPVSTAMPGSGTTYGSPPPSSTKKYQQQLQKANASLASSATASQKEKEKISDPLSMPSPSPSNSPIPGGNGESASTKTASSSSSASATSEVPPSSQNAPARVDNSGPAMIEEVDPLTGMVISRPAAPASAAMGKRPSMTSTSGKHSIAGEGTGYANMPESVTTGPSTPMSTHKTVGGSTSAAGGMQTPTQQSSSSRQGLSLFSPNWFPTSSSASTTAGGTAGTTRDKKKDRQSVGVDLRDLHLDGQPLSSAASTSTASTTAGGGSGGTSGGSSSNNGVREGSTALRAKGNAVRDRLLEIADHLNQLSAICAASSPTGAGSSENDGEEDVCAGTAKRLMALASVLAGDSSIVDFDIKFANKELTTLLPNQVKIQAGANVGGSSATRRGSGSSSISVTAGPASMSSLSHEATQQQQKTRTDSMQSSSTVASGMDMKSVSTDSYEGESPSKATQELESEGV